MIRSSGGLTGPLVPAKSLTFYLCTPRALSPPPCLAIEQKGWFSLPVTSKHQHISRPDGIAKAHRKYPTDRRKAIFQPSEKPSFPTAIDVVEFARRLVNLDPVQRWKGMTSCFAMRMPNLVTSSCISYRLFLNRGLVRQSLLLRRGLRSFLLSQLHRRNIQLESLNHPACSEFICFTKSFFLRWSSENPWKMERLFLIFATRRATVESDW